MPQSPPGRKGKITHLRKANWDKILEQTPNQYQLLNTDSRQWTLELIVLYLQKYHQISVTTPAVYYALRRTGRRTGRSKLRIGSPDPDYQVKRQTIEKLTNLPKRIDSHQSAVDSPRQTIRCFPQSLFPEQRDGCFTLTKPMSVGVRKAEEFIGSSDKSIKLIRQVRIQGSISLGQLSILLEKGSTRFTLTRPTFRLKIIGRTLLRCTLMTICSWYETTRLLIPRPNSTNSSTLTAKGFALYRCQHIVLT